MPHQCTNCGHVFEDGSKEMLSGCPDCGGNKFQYHPGAVPDDPPADAEPPEREGGSVTGAVGRAANKVRDAVSSDSVSPTPDPDATDPSSDDVVADAEPASEATADASDPSVADAGSAAAPETEGVGDDDAESTDDSAAGDATVNADPADSEDSAQAVARSEVVDRNSLPDASEGRVVKEPDAPEERPDLGDLRDELNDQFESIRIVAPGQYELNLMELYDRQEYIIALQEDGQYVIEVPDAWDAPESPDDG
jgi:predicted  nucleic acid-binding Zn-ribbon protein